MTDSPATPPLSEAPPLAVKAGTAATIQTLLITIALASVTVLGALTTVFSFVKTKDMASLIVWLRSSDALQAISALTLIAGAAGMVFRSLKRKWREVFLASNAPNSVAYIVGQQSPTSPDSRARNENTPSPRLVPLDAITNVPKLELTGLPGRHSHILDDPDTRVISVSPAPSSSMGASNLPPADPELDKLAAQLANHADDEEDTGPNISGDALDIPVIDLRTPSKGDK